jgi:peptidyl-prolyl cis-trans isomerase SurA
MGRRSLSSNQRRKTTLIAGALIVLLAGGTVVAQIGKSGLAVSLTEEMITWSQWDLIAIQLRLAGQAMARHKEKKIFVIVVDKILPKSPKSLAECRGLVTADYQNYLEKEWLDYLKKKYIVKVNNDVISTIK